MPWVLLGLLSLYGLLSLVFAFVEPPNAVRGLFKVPGIFVFLPDKMVVPVGRIFVAVSSFVLVGFIAVTMLGASAGR